MFVALRIWNLLYSAWKSAPREEAIVAVSAKSRGPSLYGDLDMAPMAKSDGVRPLKSPVSETDARREGIYVGNPFLFVSLKSRRTTSAKTTHRPSRLAQHLEKRPCSDTQGDGVFHIDT